MESFILEATKSFNFEQTIIIIGVLGLIQYLVNKGQTKKLSTNHFTHLGNKLELIDKSLTNCKESADSLRRIEEKLDRMNENIVYLRVKLNGRK